MGADAAGVRRGLRALEDAACGDEARAAALGSLAPAAAVPADAAERLLLALPAWGAGAREAALRWLAAVAPALGRGARGRLAAAVDVVLQQLDAAATRDAAAALLDHVLTPAHVTPARVARVRRVAARDGLPPPLAHALVRLHRARPACVRPPPPPAAVRDAARFAAAAFRAERELRARLLPGACADAAAPPALAAAPAAPPPGPSLGGAGAILATPLARVARWDADDLAAAACALRYALHDAAAGARAGDAPGRVAAVLRFAARAAALRPPLAALCAPLLLDAVALWNGADAEEELLALAALLPPDELVALQDAVWAPLARRFAGMPDAARARFLEHASLLLLRWLAAAAAAPVAWLCAELDAAALAALARGAGRRLLWAVLLLYARVHAHMYRRWGVAAAWAPPPAVLRLCLTASDAATVSLACGVLVDVAADLAAQRAGAAGDADADRVAAAQAAVARAVGEWRAALVDERLFQPRAGGGSAVVGLGVPPAALASVPPDEHRAALSVRRSEAFSGLRAAYERRRGEGGDGGGGDEDAAGYVAFLRGVAGAGALGLAGLAAFLQA